MSQLSAEPALPRLLFLRWIKAGQPGFLLRHLEEQLACLRQFFEVTLVDEDCDYDEVCDRVRPDIALFESGIYARHRSVRNAHTHPDVPKVGFLNADACDPVRAAFVADMANWGVETFFTVSAAMADFTPEIADRLFCWPNFIDPDVHRDHGLVKSVPVLLTGSQMRHYPWRNRVNRVLAQHYPTLAMPHFGWADTAATRRMIMGEAYARLVNTAYFAPSCGSYTRDLVRKHLEIPASRTCLITERTPAVEAAGFEDMTNCVFADADDVVDKVDALLGDLGLLDRITQSGHALVHGRHTAAHRRQLRDWFDLWSEQRSAVGIRQADIFAPLTREVPDPAGAPRQRIVTGASEDRPLLGRAWQSLAAGWGGEAALHDFTRATNYRYMPEAEVGICVAELATGRAAAAARTVDALIDHVERLHGTVEPDPVWWALHLQALLCRGRVREAVVDARRHPAVHHDELDRTRWVVATIGGVTPTRPGPRRASVSPLPERSWATWMGDLRGLLARNGQGHLTAALRGAEDQQDPAQLTRGAPERPPEVWLPGSVAAATGVVGRPSPGVLVRRCTAGAREVARRIVTREWLDIVAEVAEKEPIDEVLVVAPSVSSLRERALRTALARNPRLPEVRTLPPQAPPQRLHGQATLVYLGRQARVLPDWSDWLVDARVVVVDGSRRPGVPALLTGLLDAQFELVALDAGGTGYHVLRHRLARQAWLRAIDDRPDVPPLQESASRGSGRP